MTAHLFGYQGLDERIAGQGADSIWIGDKVHLRAREPSDADVIPSFEHSADERSGWKIFPPRSRAAARKAVEESADNSSRSDRLTLDLAIARREDDLIVGGINVHEANQTNGTFAYGVGIGREHKGNGYAAEAVLLVMRFMFDERRFQKCEARVYDYNSASISLHRKLGFTEEGRLRRHLFLAGEYRDELMFGMTVEEFRELYPKLKPAL